MGRSQRAVLAWLVLVAAVTAVVAVGNDAPAASAQQESLTSEERQSAALIYSSECATCHGAGGGGGDVPTFGGEAPPLTSDNVSVPYLDLVLRTGRMPPQGNPWDNRARREPYPDERREVLVAYLAEEFGLEGEIPEVGEGDPARGQDVWNSNCAHCHGNTGAGGVAGGGAWTPAIEEYDPVTIAEGIRVGPFQMPAFDESQISDEGVADVAAYMEEVRSEPGTLLGFVELNPVFVSGFVALLAVVLAFVMMWVSGRPTWFPDPEGQGGQGDSAAKDETA